MSPCQAPPDGLIQLVEGEEHNYLSLWMFLESVKYFLTDWTDCLCLFLNSRNGELLQLNYLQKD